MKYGKKQQNKKRLELYNTYRRCHELYRKTVCTRELAVTLTKKQN